MPAITQTDAEHEAWHEAWRTSPAPTANELRDLAKRLRTLAQSLELAKPGDPFVRDDCVGILKPVIGWYSRAFALQDKDQMKIFRRVSELQSKILWRKVVAVDLLVSRFGTLASEVDDLATTLEPHSLMPPKHKLTVNRQTSEATLDDQIIPLKRQQAKALALLIASQGEYVSLADNGLRSRDIDSLPLSLKELVETQPGAGTRILRDKVEWLN